MSPPSRRTGTGEGRHRAREVALQVLFAIDLGRLDVTPVALDATGDDDGDEDDGDDAPAPPVADLAFDRVAGSFDVPSASAVFARELVREVCARRAELDALVAAHSRNWRVERMAAVDRNVMRLAVYELRHSETPVAVVIDEAVDLARRFGGEASSGFVNGVLDAVARVVRAA